MSTRKILISAKCARLKFNGCEPEYIKHVCHARCCQSPNAPTGVLVQILSHEREAIRQQGGRVDRNYLLLPNRGEQQCPFLTSEHLCGLHDKGLKPLNCSVSPFTLNKNGKLIVSHRYIALKCYNDGRKLPAYQAFGLALAAIFGLAEAARITSHFDAGGGDCEAEISEVQFARLASKRKTFHSVLKPQEATS